MAESVGVIERRRVTIVEKRAYRWPEVVLALIFMTLFVCASVVLGTFAYLTYEQNRLFVAIPWYFPYLISISVITIFYLFGMITLFYVHLLLPAIVLPLSFVMFVLWMTGLIKSSIELWGPLGSINDNCVRYVYDNSNWGGRTIDTLARIQQEGVCNLWKASFSFEMIATFLLLWLMVMSWQVIRASRY
ncbi:hypothetical protein RUND412_003414 [Rhizina undulata]